MSLGLAFLSSRMGPPDYVTLLVVGDPGITGTVEVAGLPRRPLPFQLELPLIIESDSQNTYEIPSLTNAVPGSSGVLFDKLHASDDGPSEWWIGGEANGLHIYQGFRIAAFDAAEAPLQFLGFASSERTDIEGPYRIIRVGRAE